jgi:hypothetical protein
MKPQAKIEQGRIHTIGPTMPDEIPLDTGANGLIIPSPNGNLVRKKMRRNAIGNPIEVQMRIHRITQQILTDQNNFTTLRAPYLQVSQAAHAGGGSGTEEYWMERIDTSQPLWLGDQDSVNCYSQNLVEDVKLELVRYWRQIWERGYAPWDFELYVQRDNSVVLLDFDKFGRRIDDDQVQMPYRVTVPPQRFFTHICFPPDFAERVANPFRTTNG